MKKSTKAVLIISGIVMVILLILIGIISYFEKLQPEKINYPGSGLSGSIFDTQNTAYAPNSSLSETYKYTNIPYLLDVPTSNKAILGDGMGVAYQFRKGLYAYTAEFPYSTDLDFTLASHLGKVLMLDCNDDMTILETMKEEIGYKNGYGIIYNVKNIYVSNGISNVKAVLMTYYIELPEEEEDAIIGILSTTETNEAIRQMKDLLDAEFATFRYEEKQIREIEKRTQDEQRAEDAAIREAEQEIAKEQKAAEQAQKEEEKRLAELTTTVDVDVEIEDYYNELNLNLSWATNNAVTGIFLISPKGQTYEPYSLTEKTADFTVYNAEPGNWIARVTGVNVGTVNIVMREGNPGQTVVTEEDITVTSTPSGGTGGETTTTITTTTE